MLSFAKDVTPATIAAWKNRLAHTMGVGANTPGSPIASESGGSTSAELPPPSARSGASGGIRAVRQLP